MAEGTSFALVQLCGLATAFQAGTLLDSVNPPKMGTVGLFTRLVPTLTRHFLICWPPKDPAWILNVEFHGGKWHPRRISHPIGPT